MTPGERLIARLRTEHGIDLPDGTRVQRTYAGYWQKAGGAWAWLLVDTEGRMLRPSIGSPWPVTRLLRSKVWTLYQADNIAGYPGEDIIVDLVDDPAQ
jgi:hypothetical protein